MRNSCSGAQNFETCLGTCFRASGSRLPPYLLTFFNWFCGQTIGMWGSDGRIEPIYFDYKFSDLTIFFLLIFWVPLGPYGFSGLPGIDFTIKKLIFTRKIRNTGISSETTIPGISSETTETRESRVRRRRPSHRSLTAIPPRSLRDSYKELPGN